MASIPTKEQILKILSEVKDPEIPVIDCIELGIIRDVMFKESKVIVEITPTYSGCPAMKEIENEIIATLNRHGFSDAQVNLVFTPAWSTDWITEEGKQKLKEYGIAPPEKTQSDEVQLFSIGKKKVQCPFCDSLDTFLKTEFSSTACKALHYCNACSQPFEQFKSF
jgi:ring-1,2-phenylacetyl-CoA epoxidase subunit PaaD